MQLVPSASKRAISQRFTPLIGRGAFLPTIGPRKKHVYSDWIAGARSHLKRSEMLTSIPEKNTVNFECLDTKEMNEMGRGDKQTLFIMKTKSKKITNYRLQSQGPFVH